MQQETEKLQIWLQRSWVLYVLKAAGLGGSWYAIEKTICCCSLTKLRQLLSCFACPRVSDHRLIRCVQEGRSVLGGVFDDPLLLLQHYSNSKDEQERKKKSSKPPTTAEEAHGVVVVVLVVMKLAVDDVFMSVRSSLWDHGWLFAVICLLWSEDAP